MTKPPSRTPLSIKIISTLYLWGSLAELRGLSHSAIVFGFIVSGTPAFSKHLLSALLLLGLAIGLWRLHEATRRISIFYECYNLLETWILMPLLVSKGSSSTFLLKDIIAKDMPRLARNPAAEKLIIILSAVFGFAMSIITLVIIWFLIKRKSAFVKSTK